MPANRQLAAILFADIEGYTALMQEDEEKARLIRNKFQTVVEDSCKSHHGHIIQFIGDGVLCMFKSAIEAVKAATEIQTHALLEPKVPLRIGIHSGDVVFEGNNVYGDGVNVASRIESFAVAGSVFISGKVFDEIKNQKDISTVSLGKFNLKNVKQPLEIFAVSNSGLKVPDKKHLEGKGIQAASRKNEQVLAFLILAGVVVIAVLAIALRDKFQFSNKAEATELRTIAVLPFANLSASKEDEYFADGICDEILTQISKIGELNVMSRTSTLQYKNTTKSIKQIGDELGVDVLLEGSVQKSNDKIRIHAQLINAKNDRHLWAETYDRDLKDIFVIQTDLAKQIASALNATLTEKEISLFEEKRTDNLQAYDFYLRGNDAFTRFWEYGKLEEGPRAVRMYEEAIRLDPNFTAPYAAIIKLYLTVSWIKGDEYHDQAKSWLDKMLALNANDAPTHHTIAFYKSKGEMDYKGALAELDVVDKMTGNGKLTYELRAEILRSTGRIDESIYYSKKQAALFPKSPRYMANVAETFKLTRNFDSSLYYINKAIEINPDVAGLYMRKSMYYAELKGDVAAASAILEHASSLVDTNEFKSDFIYFEILKGNYDKAIEHTLSMDDTLGVMWLYKFLPNDLSIAILYDVNGQHESAKIYFQKAYETTSKLSKEYPDDFRLHSALGVALAGLGQKEAAINEGIRGRELMPVSKDAIIGVSPLENLALIYTLLGEEDEAIAILKQMLQMPFVWTMSNTIALYKIHYFWKPLHGNPAFEEMISTAQY